MSKNIITVSREFGSGGRAIGEAVAKRLNYQYYDKDIIAKVAKETGFSEEYVAKSGEYANSKNIFAYAFTGRDMNGMSIDDYVFNAQRKIILDIAEKGNCVIVGRCADYILRERDDVLNVFIIGEPEKKIERIKSMYSVSESEAKKLIKDTDKKRSINYNYYTDQIWGRNHNYAITLNSSILGMDKCIDIIEELAK
ncbi:cytidylate kinase-like family protein [Falcatimonas sp. MSJ-15]|uniref:cytidylate kinase-like family protein n=1 Tax=Falcatimonas sp. MSJ-15 TaxID=2841515 RepID=UPI001C0FDCC6|nr:cytidylate kinase-like family protein [Falcatimonas sp. MSJ-15]MBU5468814.1 cytidylate kinase-like family protein [Falcatimonas sp. MSJ-15]